MADDITIRVAEGAELDGALVVFGGPTLGLVGTITARYLVQSLGMKIVGGLHSDRFPASTLVHEGRPFPPVSIHALETKCGLDLGCDRLVVVTSELVMEARAAWPLARVLIDWTRSVDAALVVVPDALVPSTGTGPGKTVRGVGTSADVDAFIARADVQPMIDGVVVGSSAALLSVAAEAGADLVCLFAESHPDHPDARAAARLVEVLDHVLPDVRLETGPLEEEAERIERNVRQMRAQLQAQSGTSGDRPEMPMFH